MCCTYIACGVYFHLMHFHQTKRNEWRFSSNEKFYSFAVRMSNGDTLHTLGRLPCTYVLTFNIFLITRFLVKNIRVFFISQRWFIYFFSNFNFFVFSAKIRKTRSSYILFAFGWEILSTMGIKLHSICHHLGMNFPHTFSFDTLKNVFQFLVLIFLWFSFQSAL